jgi:hypothetical protein
MAGRPVDRETTHPGGRTAASPAASQPGELAAPPTGAQVTLHWATLRFSQADVERDFLEDYASAAVAPARVSLGLGVVLYAAFGALDPYVIPEVVTLAWLVRYGVVCPMLAVAVGLSSTPFFQRRLQPILAFLALVCGAGIIVMIAAAAGAGEPYYAGLLLVSAFTYTAVRLRFALAAVVCWALASLYVATALGRADVGGATLVSNVGFLLGFNVIGMSGGYAMERSTRREYLQRRTIAAQAAHLAEALGKVKVLAGLLPICAWCHKIRSDGGYWQRIEAYLSAHSEASFTHGICPDCLERIDTDAG